MSVSGAWQNQAKGTMSTRRLVAPMAPPRAKRSSSSSKKAAPTLVMMVRPPSVRAALTARSPSSGSLLMVRRDHDPVTRLDCTHLAQMNDQLPLSWWRFIRAVVAYCLLVTDVLRGGIGMRDLRDHHQVIEPDLFLFFGPWAYPVQALYSNVTDGMQTPVWPYKFDTTSIVWRAFAQHLQLDVFPPCLQYQSACPGDTFNATIAFAMIDAMVNAVAATRPRSHLARDPWLLSLRARTRFKDRLHNLLLSDALNNKIWRTNQAVYYRTNVVVAPDFRICFDRRVDLMLCGDSWTNFQRACASTDADCLAIGNIWLHIVRRVRQVQAQFPDHTVDLTLLLSSEDLLVNLGGISLSARRAADVSSIVRARKCSRHNSSSIFNATACETVYVEDYRHEVLFFQTDADEWFHCVALLRLSAQVYVILRLIALAMSCVASQRRAKQPVWQAFRLFWRAPPQTIIYGSQFPIVCYALAHLIDAPITYEMINQHFTTPIGKYKFQPLAFVTIAATQMRNIWLLALFAHALFGWLALRSSGVRLNIEGVLGMPARWLAILSSLTILSQLRSLSFRDTHVLNTYEIPASTRVSLLRKTTCVSANRGLNNAVMDGIIIDLKVFGCLIIVLVAAQLVVNQVISCIAPLAGGGKRMWRMLGITRTPASFACGHLWPTSALTMRWYASTFWSTKLGVLPTTAAKAQAPYVDPQEQAEQMLSPTAPSRRGHRFSLFTPDQTKHRRSSVAQMMATLERQPKSRHYFAYMQYNMEHVHDRHNAIKINIAFMNLVLMSDPIVWFQLRVFPGHTVCFAKSHIAKEKMVLWPIGVVHQQRASTEFEHVAAVSTEDIAWLELIQTG